VLSAIIGDDLPTAYLVPVLVCDADDPKPLDGDDNKAFVAELRKLAERAQELATT
jgi:hypothetical protein